VNCAGICQIRNVEDITEEEWDRMMSINLKGTFFLCQSVLKEMKKYQKGKIVNMGSIAGEIGGILVGANYSSSKAGIYVLQNHWQSTQRHTILTSIQFLPVL